ncbi:MAG: hypothetical protein M3008_06465, partial [Chloroflexota bacterium]|nr:hypothetical protein [Chloroflexota bacterium]
ARGALYGTFRRIHRDPVAWPRLRHFLLSLAATASSCPVQPVEGDNATSEIRVDRGASWTLRARVMDGPTALRGVDLLVITNPLFSRA